MSKESEIAKILQMADMGWITSAQAMRLIRDLKEH